MDERTRKLVHSSGKKDWGTPPEFFARLNDIYHFTLDPAANQANAKCAKFFTEKMNGLKQSWEGHKVYLNPPYGEPEYPCAKNAKTGAFVNSKGKPTCVKKICKKRGYHNLTYIPGIEDWIKKCHEEAQKGILIVALLPARTGTKWWHRYVWDQEKLAPRKGVTVDFVEGRLRFEGAPDSAPFDSVVIIWNNDV